MIKILVLVVGLLGQFRHTAVDVPLTVQALSDALRHVILRVCDNVDPGDEDHYE